MAKRILAVYDPCQVYLERFVRFVSEQGELGYKAQGYTDLCILVEQLQENRIDAVLLALDDNCKAVLQENRALMDGFNRFGGIVLFMGRQQGSSEWKQFLTEAGYEGEVRYINRFQSVPEILHFIQMCILENSDPSAVQDPGGPLFLAGMYSPTDKTSHPREAAAILKEWKKVLYISLEQFSGFTSFLAKGCGTLSDILYCYKTSPGKLPQQLMQVTGHGYGMDILTAPDDLADLEVLSEKEWPEFLRAVARAGDYQYIFLDMSMFEWKLIDMVLSYGNLYIPALPYDPSETFRSVLVRKTEQSRECRRKDAAKMEEFRRYFIQRGMEEELKKIREVRIETD